MRMGGKSHGYTVLEVMIFMAVSAFLLVAAFIAVGGRQAEVQFSQGARDLESKIRDVINDVATGYFPNSGDFHCRATGSGVSFDSSSSDAQGTSEECVFLGKALQFRENSELNIITIAGRRDANTLAESRPTAAVQGSVDITEVARIQNGVRVTRVARLNSPTFTQFGTVAFVGRPGSDSSSSSTSVTDFILVNGTGLTSSKVQTVNAINNGSNFLSSPLNPVEGAIICLSDGPGGSRRAAITIGGSGGRTTTRLDFDTRNRVVCP